MGLIAILAMSSIVCIYFVIIDKLISTIRKNDKLRIVCKEYANGEVAFYIQKRIVGFIWLYAIEDYGLYLAYLQFNSLEDANDYVRCHSKNKIRRKILKTSYIDVIENGDSN